MLPHCLIFIILGLIGYILNSIMAELIHFSMSLHLTDPWIYPDWLWIIGLLLLKLKWNAGTLFQNPDFKYRVSSCCCFILFCFCFCDILNIMYLTKRFFFFFCYCWIFWWIRKCSFQGHLINFLGLALFSAAILNVSYNTRECTWNL